MYGWTKEYQAVFLMLKEVLCKQPILKYPDTSKPYVLFTDIQPYEEIDVLTPSTANTPHTKIIHHPVTYVTGLFRGSKLNWAAITKGAYAIYLSVKKLRFYLTNADVLIRSDHLPLKKFLKKNTMNTKANNWAVEFESYSLKFENI